jgi:hypothetical protein
MNGLFHSLNKKWIASYNYGSNFGVVFHDVKEVEIEVKRAVVAFSSVVVGLLQYRHGVVGTNERLDLVFRQHFINYTLTS